jgi:hypothetical protein
VYAGSGFIGLSLFYVLLSLGAVFLFWNIARRLSSLEAASLALLALLPLIAGRAEVRPEAWSYFLSGLFLDILLFRRRFLWALPLLMALWVNLHIGFIFGFLVFGACGLEELWKWRKGEVNRFKLVAWVGLAALGGAMLNPFGPKLVLYPLNIFKNYGYRIVENQSIFFLERLGFSQGMHFGLFALSLAALVGGTVWLLASRALAPRVVLALPLLLAVLATLGVRHFAIYALFAVPALALVVREGWLRVGEEVAAFLSMGAVAVLLSLQAQDLARAWPNVGWGLMPDALAAEQFFSHEGLTGPIFNNYDVGGYLIFGLFPRERVYVDNRPEAYSESFFQNEYIAPQEDENAWRALDERYGFNAIFFYYRDYTPWAQAFLARRLADPAWAPVYADAYDIIFLKRKAENAAFIASHEIPQSAFGISSDQ